MPALRPFAPLHSPTSADPMSPFRSALALLIAAPPRGRLLQSRSGRARRTGGADAADPGLDRQLHARCRPARHGQQDLAVGRQRAGADPLLDGRRPDFAWVVGQRRIFAGEWQVNTAPDAGGQSITQICLRYPGVRQSGPQPDLELPPGRHVLLRDGRARSGRSVALQRPHPGAVRARAARRPTSPRWRAASPRSSVCENETKATDQRASVRSRRARYRGRRAGRTS